MEYQRIILSGPMIDGEPGLPEELFGLDDPSLADLTPVLNPCPPEYQGIGYWPIQEVDPLPPNKVSSGRHVELVGGQPKWIDDLVDGPRPTAAEVSAERDRRVERGEMFTVTGYGDVPLTGRGQDQINLLWLKDASHELKAAGVTAPALEIRDANNVNHMLTADQMLELISAGVAWIMATNKRAWDMIDGDSPFEVGVPYDYTEDAYWP